MQKQSSSKSPTKQPLQRKNTLQRDNEAAIMRSALAEVSKHAESQKFKRENPDIAYKHVKSKLAGNMKSIEKAKKRD
jgi:hypothetical protein